MYKELLRNQVTDTQFQIECLSAELVESKRIRDAALYTFVYHYTFAAKSKSLII